MERLQAFLEEVKDVNFDNEEMDFFTAMRFQMALNAAEEEGLTEEEIDRIVLDVNPTLYKEEYR